MIFTVTYNETAPKMNAGFFPNMKQVDPYAAIFKLLEGTDDTVIFVVTRQQLKTFKQVLTRYSLDKFLIVDHRDTDTMIERGVTNRNYPDDRLKLKLFVLKGAKSNA